MVLAKHFLLGILQWRTRLLCLFSSSVYRAWVHRFRLVSQDGNCYLKFISLDFNFSSSLPVWPKAKYMTSSCPIRYKMIRWRWDDEVEQCLWSRSPKHCRYSTELVSACHCPVLLVYPMHLQLFWQLGPHVSIIYKLHELILSGNAVLSQKIWGTSFRVWLRCAEWFPIGKRRGLALSLEWWSDRPALQHPVPPGAEDLYFHIRYSLFFSLGILGHP